MQQGQSNHNGVRVQLLRHIHVRGRGCVYQFRQTIQWGMAHYQREYNKL